MYVIQLQATDLYIAGFSREHSIVQRTTRLEYAKSFKTMAAAVAWFKKHADAGYGLRSSERINVIDLKDVI